MHMFLFKQYLYFSTIQFAENQKILFQCANLKVYVHLFTDEHVCAYETTDECDAFIVCKCDRFL